MSEIRDIGWIANSYGGLTVKEKDGKYFWAVQDYDGGYDWDEIPEYLFAALNRYENERDAGTSNAPSSHS